MEIFWIRSSVEDVSALQALYAGVCS